MQAVIDRIVQYPNRYQLTNVETQEVLGTFDFDEVTGTVQQVGTEINKALFDSIATDLAARVVSNGGELSKTIVTFPDVSGTAANVASGDTSATLWGKVKNWFSRLKALAFKDKISNTDVAENAAIAQSKVNGLESALAGKQPTITGAATSITNNNLTASRVVVSDESGKIDVSAVTATELNYISGADRNIQNQIEDIKDGTTPPVQAMRAQQDGDGANIVQTYAKKKGSYPNMTVGNATNATNAANAENANNAASANKVANALTVVVDGESTVYDGSAARTVDINTTSSTDPEAVHFTEQALTSEQQTQARENIGAAGTRGTYPDLTAGKAISDAAGNDISDTYAKQSDISNPNLIINPDFKINQRNKRNTDIGSQSYGADRWKQLNYSNGVVFTSDDFLQITGDTPATNLSQPFEEIPPAGDYTLSVMSGSSKTNLSVKSMNFTITDNGELQINSIISLGVGMYLLSVYITDGVFDVRFTCLGNSGTCYVKWVKLEKGSVATMFVPPNITTELLKCQRYYMTYKANWVPCAIDTTGASASVPIPFATQMRAIPTITSKSNPGWIRANTTRVNITISSVTIAEAAVDAGRAVYAFTPVTDAIKYSAGYISSVDIALDAEI